MSLEPPPRPRETLAARLLAQLPGLTKFVRRRMGPELRARESASDIVQSTCREVLLGAEHLAERGELDLSRWVRAAAEHKLQNRARHWRAQRRAGTEAVPSESAFQAPSSTSPTRDARLREEAERLTRAFLALTSDERNLLRRSQIDGASHAEIGQELELSSEAVRKRIARALARLSAQLDEPDPD